MPPSERAGATLFQFCSASPGFTPRHHASCSPASAQSSNSVVLSNCRLSPFRFTIRPFLWLKLPNLFKFCSAYALPCDPEFSTIAPSHASQSTLVAGHRRSSPVRVSTTDMQSPYPRVLPSLIFKFYSAIREPRENPREKKVLTITKMRVIM